MCGDGRCAVTVLWLGDAMRLLKPCNGGGIPFTNCHSPLLCGLTTTCRLCSLVRSTMEHSYKISRHPSLPVQAFATALANLV